MLLRFWRTAACIGVASCACGSSSSSIGEAWDLFHSRSVHRRAASRLRNVEGDVRRLRIMYRLDPYAEYLPARELSSFRDEVSGDGASAGSTVERVKVGELPEPFTRLPGLRISHFTTGTAKELNRLLPRPTRSSPPLVIDVRGNPGGSLHAAVQSASIFLKPDTCVARVAEAGGAFDYELATEPHRLLSRFRRDWRRKADDAPVFVLIDRDTASAAELFAGALTDHCRAMVVGPETEPETFFFSKRSKSSAAKGSVQSPLMLRDGSALLLTTHLFTTPNHRSVDEYGIEPTCTITGLWKQVVKARKSRRSDDEHAAAEDEGPLLAQIYRKNRRCCALQQSSTLKIPDVK